MSDAFWVALFGLAGTCLTALLSWLNRQELQAANAKSDVTNVKLNDVHDAVNGGWAELKQKLNTAVDALAVATQEILTLKAEVVNLRHLNKQQQQQQQQQQQP